MKRVLAALFGTVAGLVMLLNFKTHSVSVANVPAAVGTSGNTDPTPSTTPSSSSGSSSSAERSASGTKTYTGDAVETRWGPVQVRITVTNGKVARADAIVYPTGNPQDQQINSYAVPALDQEAVSAGSAQIDMISGATYTSEGYLQSLQSALDKAGL